MIYISGILYDNISERYHYKSKYNIIYLKEICQLMFVYLFLLKIIFLRIILFKKIIFIGAISSFYLLLNINELYKYRLKSIEMKEDFRHPLQIFVFSPNKKYIQNIINKTNYFTFTNFLLLTNVLVYMLS
jgi:hypothetical protein